MLVTRCVSFLQKPYVKMTKELDKLFVSLSSTAVQYMHSTDNLFVVCHTGHCHAPADSPAARTTGGLVSRQRGLPACAGKLARQMHRWVVLTLNASSFVCRLRSGSKSPSGSRRPCCSRWRSRPLSRPRRRWRSCCSSTKRCQSRIRCSRPRRQCICPGRPG